MVSFVDTIMNQIIDSIAYDPNSKKTAPWKLPHWVVESTGFKGGPGKSTSVVNLAYRLAKRGVKTAVADLDIDAPRIPALLGLQTPMELKGLRFQPIVKDGIKFASNALISTSLQASSLTGEQHRQRVNLMIRGIDWGDIDVLLADMPAGSSDEYIAAMECIGEDNIVGEFITLRPDDYIDLMRVCKLADYHNLRVLGLIENMRGAVSSCCLAPVRCAQCGKEFEPFAVPDDAQMLRKACQVEQVVYLGAVPLHEGHTLAVTKDSNPVFPDQLQAPFDLLADIVVESITALKGSLRTRDREAAIGEILSKRLEVKADGL